jgi:hypothetical protein
MSANKRPIESEVSDDTTPQKKLVKKETEKAGAEKIDLAEDFDSKIATQDLIVEGKTFHNVTSLFAAVVEGKPKLVQSMLVNDTEVCCLLKKFDKKPQDDSLASYSLDVCKVKSEEELLLIIEDLEISGAACILYGDQKIRQDALIFWAVATKLRHSNVFHPMTKTLLPLTPVQELVFGSKEEFESYGELNALTRQRRKHLSMQAIFVIRRILDKYGFYPNFFVLESNFHALLKGWRDKELETKKAFQIVMQLIEIINAEQFKKQPMLDDVIKTIYLIIFELQSLVLGSTKNVTVTIESLLTCLSFTMALFHIQSLKKIPNEQMDELMRIILQRLVQFKIPDIDAKRLSHIVEQAFACYERVVCVMPSCLGHHLDCLKNMAINKVFQEETWIQPLKGFLKIMEPVSAVPPLFCIASARVKELEIEPEEISKSSQKFQELMLQNPNIQPEVISEWLKKMEQLMLQH